MPNRKSRISISSANYPSSWSLTFLYWGKCYWDKESSWGALTILCRLSQQVKEQLILLNSYQEFLPKAMVSYLLSLHVLGKLSRCSIWHLNLPQDLLLSPAWKQWSSTQLRDHLSKGPPGRILSQPAVTGRCPSSPPRHEHLSNSLLLPCATYCQTHSHPSPSLLKFFCCLQVGPGAFKTWNKCVEMKRKRFW